MFESHCCHTLSSKRDCVEYGHKMSIRANKDSFHRKNVSGIFTQKMNNLKADHFDVKLAKKRHYYTHPFQSHIAIS